MEIISMWGSLSFGVDVTIYTFRYKSVEFVCPWFFKFCSLCMFRLPRSFQLHLFDKFFQQISVFHFTLILDFSGFSSSYFWTPLLFKSKTKTKIWYFVYQNNGMAATVWDFSCVHWCWCMWMRTHCKSVGTGSWLREKNPLPHQGFKPTPVLLPAFQLDALPTELFLPLVRWTVMSPLWAGQ